MEADAQKQTKDSLPDVVPPSSTEDSPVKQVGAETRERLASLTLSVEEELAHAREQGEVSTYDCDVNYLYQFATEGIPLAREDVGSDPVVISRTDFAKQFGNLQVITPSGDVAMITLEDFRGDTLIILPRNLGSRQKAKK